jgi:hypothetical protein
VEDTHKIIEIYIVVYRPVSGHGRRGEQRDSSCCLVTAGEHVNNTQAIGRQLLGKRVAAATNTHAVVEVLLDCSNGNGVFYVIRAEML